MALLEQPLANVTFEIPVDLIDPAPDNVRGDIGDIADLAASIAAQGLINPLTVVERGDRYEVVAGHRRLAAAKHAAVDRVSCVVRELADDERVELMLVENLQRSDLSPLEEARAYQRLHELGLSQRVIAGKVGCAQSHVSKRLALTRLPGEIAGALDSGEITIEDAVELTRLHEHPKLLAAAFHRRDRWDGIAGQVRNALEQLDGDRRVAEETARLQATGVRVVELSGRNTWNPDPPNGMSVVDRWDGVAVEPDEHAKLPCHAVGLKTVPGSKEVQQVPVCTDPATHGGTRQEQSNRDRDRHREKIAKEHAEADAARERRHGVVAAIVAGKPNRDDVAELTVAALTSEPFEGDAWLRAACTLGLVDNDDADNVCPEETTRQIHERARKSQIDRDRVLVALAAAHLDDQIGSSWRPLTSSASVELVAYYTVLERHGYKPTKDEARILREARA